MAGKVFELTEETLSVIEELGGHMPGGLFIYRADEPGELIGKNTDPDAMQTKCEHTGESPCDRGSDQSDGDQ